MQLATTIQFRKAVRKYAKKKGLIVAGSWTNPGKYAQRNVGICVAGATDATAAKIEKKLNKKGLTAKTRCTQGGNSPSGMVRDAYAYIRGTCSFGD
jgi:hypothetical protein